MAEFGWSPCRLALADNVSTRMNISHRRFSIVQLLLLFLLFGSTNFQLVLTAEGNHDAVEDQVSLVVHDAKEGRATDHLLESTQNQTSTIEIVPFEMCRQVATDFCCLLLNIWEIDEKSGENKKKGVEFK